MNRCPLVASFAKLLSIILVTLALPTLGLTNSASGPTNENHSQTAYVKTQGPAFLTMVTLKTLYDTKDQFVFGYKKSGTLGDSAEQVSVWMKITFVVRRHGELNEMEITTERTINISREWNRTGYLSAGYPIWGLYDGAAMGTEPKRIKRIELAFSANGRWDSNMNKNYVFDVDAMRNDSDQMTSTTHTWNLSIAEDVWKFIASKMR